MRLKTFIGSSMPEVMKQVRTEMGANAFIISTLQEAHGVRITAALEYIQSQSTAPTMTTPSQPFAVIDNFMRLVERQRLPHAVAELIINKLTTLDNRILSQGLPGIVQHAFALSTDNPWTHKQNQQPPYMVIGPTGGGKTVTTAKLAAEYILSGKRVAIITTDGEKAGAHQQLMRFAQALHIPVAFAQDAKTLYNCIHHQYTDHQILIDTTGLNPLSASELNRLAEWICAAKQAPTLVMPAGLDVYEAIDLAEIVKNLGVTQFIQTKVDCFQRFAAMLSVMFKSGLQLAALGSGPELGIRLKSATAQTMIDLLQRSRSFDLAGNQNNTAPGATSAHSVHVKEVRS